MKRDYPVEFVYQVLSLLVALIVVHTLYVTVVRPRADAILADQVAQMQHDPSFVQKRSLWVVVRDFEQEACFVLMLWAIAIMTFKGLASSRESRLLMEDLVPVPEGTRILPEDAREYARQIQELPGKQQRALLPRTLLTALQRFGATRNIQDVSSDRTRDLRFAESERLDSELSMVRYIAWAIPSIGFPRHRAGYR